MPIHDLYCNGCGREAPDTYVPLVTLTTPEITDGFLRTQRVVFPLCCGEPMTYHPPVVAVDAYEPFQRFATEVEDGRGGFRAERINSLRDLRRVERESEIRARNGEGRPMRWRDYSQDRSNGDVHTFGETPSGAPMARTSAKGKAPITVRKGAAVGAAHGASE